MTDEILCKCWPVSNGRNYRYFWPKGTLIGLKKEIQCSTDTDICIYITVDVQIVGWMIEWMDGYVSSKQSKATHSSNAFLFYLLHSNINSPSTMATIHEGKWLQAGLLKQIIKWCIAELSIKGIYSTDCSSLAFLLKSDIVLIKKKRVVAGRLFVNKINSQGIRTAGTKR